MDSKVTEKVDYIWKELNALKSTQNVGGRGLNVPSAVGDFDGQDQGPGDAEVITVVVRVHFYTTDDIGFPPFALCAYQAEDVFKSSTATGFWFDAEIENVENNHISWTISSSYDIAYGQPEGRTYFLEVQIFSLVQGRVYIERVL